MRPEVPGVLRPSIQCEIRCVMATQYVSTCLITQCSYCYVTNVRTTMSAIEERLEAPSARGLAHAVSRAVREGALAPGAKLPPIRALATQLDLSTGTPDPALLPNLGRALSELTTAGIPGSYLDDPVLPELLDVLLTQWPYPPAELMVVDGAMDGLDLVSRSLLRFGDRVVVEHPCFPPLLDLLESIGVEVAGVPVDAEGLRPEPLTAALRSPIAAVFLQPRAQNPTGASMTEQRARDLAPILAQAGLPVVEDDSAGAVAASAPISLGQWIPDQVIHIRSFSKSHGSALRLAAMSGPSELLREIIHRRQLGQGWSSRLLQRVLLSLLTDPVAIADVDHARDEYTRRRGAL